jgi:hypothetical protein
VVAWLSALLWLVHVGSMRRGEGQVHADVKTPNPGLRDSGAALTE